MKRFMQFTLVSSVFLAGCVSTSTFEAKQVELNAKNKELAACETRAKEQLDSCTSAKGETETKLKIAMQELGAYRQVAETNKSKVETLQKQEDDLRARLSKELTDKNVEIEQLKGQLSVRMLDRIAFRSGSTTILPEGMEALDKLAEAIKGSTDTIRIEGHTDDTPISERLLSRYPSNWELSAARAASVARYFETKHEIDPKRLESAGFSMYRPVAPNDSPENKERNRRVEIVLKPAADPEVAPTKPESKP